MNSDPRPQVMVKLRPAARRNDSVVDDLHAAIFRGGSELHSCIDNCGHNEGSEGDSMIDCVFDGGVVKEEKRRQEGGKGRSLSTQEEGSLVKRHGRDEESYARHAM